jgi:hypothetical protein
MRPVPTSRPRSTLAVRTSSRGSALGLVILIVLALEVLAHGSLLMARQELAASRAGLHVLQARAGAEAGAALAAGRIPTDSLAPAPLAAPVQVGGVRLGPHQATSLVQRLGPEAWLARGEGQVVGAAWSWTTDRLLWVLDPVARATEVGAALLTPAGLPPRGPGSVGGLPFVPGDAPAWCGPWTAALDSAGAWHRPRAVAPLPSNGPAGIGLGRIPEDDLAGLLPPGPDGRGTPAPDSAAGACIPGVWNWGDPDDPAGPCGARFVAASVSGPLALVGGRGQGILLVRGDLELDGTRFHGLVLVRGDLRLGPGAEIVGQLRVAGSTYLATGARVVGSPCHLVRGLDGAGGLLRQPRAVSESGFLEHR